MTVSTEDDETRGEGSSEEVMGPPLQAGPSSEDPRSAEDLEGDDGVTSEGEKPPSTEEGEEEGREAEASQSPNESQRELARGSGPSARRSVRMSPARGSRTGPTPIVWADQRNPAQRQFGNFGWFMCVSFVNCIDFDRSRTRRTSRF